MRYRPHAWLVAAPLLLIACGPPAPPQAPEVPGLEGVQGGKGGRGAPGGCATFPLSLFLNAHKELNLNQDGQAMPLEVRAYLLKGRQTFEELDFDTLRREGDKILGEDLVTSLSFTVFPTKMKIQPISAPAGTAYVALAGIFRRPDGQRWRLVFDVQSLAGRCKKGQLHTPLRANLYRNSLRLDRDMPPETRSEDQE